MTVDWIALGREFGWLVVLAGLIIYAVWKERDRLLSLVGKRAALAERAKADDLDFDEAIRRQVLNGDNYSRALVDRLFEMYDGERAERRQMVGQVMQQTAATEKMTNTSLDTMLQSVDIIRIFGNDVT